MNVIVTGATGFIGRHVVAQLVARGHAVTVVIRDTAKFRQLPWANDVSVIECDLHRDFCALPGPGDLSDVLVHLAWPGLPNYRDYFHIERNLVADLHFLRAMIDGGIPRLIVAGTCLEYGMQFGPLYEDADTHPSTPYGFAKDALRKSLEMLQKIKPFTLQWLRLFYLYGEGQNPQSLLAQLDRAIDQGQAVFNMSAGDQLRDYLPVGEVARNFVRLVENPECCGVVNCSSGKPVSVRQLVEQRCRERNSDITLNRSFYAYPDYEPLAFWGIAAKLERQIGLESAAHMIVHKVAS